MGDVKERSPLSCSKSFREHESYQTFSKKTTMVDENKKEVKKVSSEQVSIDIKEGQERDANYLKEFIFKLKNASEGLPKPLKTQVIGNTHKKTNSMTSATAKRRDLTGYYVTHKKNKEKPPISRKTPAGSQKNSASHPDHSEIRPSLAGSRSHASSLLKVIEKSVRHPQVLGKDCSLTASAIEEGDHRKQERDKKSLMVVEKSTQDFKKAFAGLSKKKLSEGCSSMKFTDSRLTPQLRPCQPDPLDKSASDI